MLTKDCECYQNWELRETCTKCDGTTRIPEDENMKVYVNVYAVTRHFGGHEEGGWWYDWYDCLECVPCKNKYSDEIKEELIQGYKHEKYGDISSVLGGQDIRVYIEKRPNESQSKEVPRYE